MHHVVKILLVITLLKVQSTLQLKSCPLNEYFVKCKLAVKEPQACDKLGSYVSQDVGSGPCLGGCVCIKGYARNTDKVCIPVKECPSCGGDFNATIGDGRHCGNLCSNYRDPYVVCGADVRSPYLCECKKGYVFNDITGQCVHRSDCPKSCRRDPYAEYKTCISDKRRTCANPKVKPPEDCSVNACDCIDNYILDRPGGKCIKVLDCPDKGCEGDANATTTSCDCGRATCESRYAQCANGCGYGFSYGCRCKSGYILKETDGPCILEQDCGWNRI